MANTLLVIILFTFAVIITTASVRSMAQRLSQRHHGQEEMDGKGQPQTYGRVLMTNLGRSAQRTVKGVVTPTDPAYASLDTRPARPFTEDQSKTILEAHLAQRQTYVGTVSLSIYHYIFIFLVASFLGLLGEEVWMWFSQGLTQSRVGVVWGPFSPLYGFGAVLLTLVLWNFRDSSIAEIFFITAVTGAAIEQTTGMVMEHFWHAQSWTYIGLPGCITQWVCWESIAAWGLLGVVYLKVVLPELIWIMGEPTSRRQVLVVGFLIAFMTIDLMLTGYCFFREGQRAQGVPPQNIIDSYVDGHFGNRFIEDHFENMVIGRQLDPNR